MKVYYYCSYTKSPVGFRLGMVDTKDACGETCVLSREQIQPFIWRCFSQGSIRKACGLFPRGTEEQDQYFMLMKSKEPIVRGEIEYFINFALVTDQISEYESWFQGQPQGEAALLQAIGDTIVLNGSSEFGFTVLTDRLNALAERSYRGLFSGIPVNISGVCVEAVSSQTDSAQILNALGLAEYNARNLGRGNWFLVKKKQKNRYPWIVAAIAAAAVAALLLILSSLRQTASSKDPSEVLDDLVEAMEAPCSNSFADSLEVSLNTFPRSQEISLMNVIETQEG